MAQAGKKRRRKHRGTQGGRIDSRRRAARPQSRAEAQQRARSRVNSKKGSRVDNPPTWRSAISRGAVAALIFTALLLLIFGRSVGAAIGLGAFMLVIYIPAGYYIDTMMWRRRERARMRAADRS